MFGRIFSRSVQRCERFAANVPTMKFKWLLSASSFAVTLLLFGNYAHATAWGDFSQSTSPLSVRISNSDHTDMTVLNTVTVTCPLNGFLVATASTLLVTAVPSPGDRMGVTLAITLDTTAPFGAPQRALNTVQGPGADALASAITIQRVVSCSINETKTLRFVASNLIDFGDAVAGNPRLVVLFFDKRI